MHKKKNIYAASAQTVWAYKRWLFKICTHGALQVSRSNTFPMEKDKDKAPTTPRGKIGHRRVDETGETTYKKVRWRDF